MSYSNSRDSWNTTKVISQFDSIGAGKRLHRPLPVGWLGYWLSQNKCNMSCKKCSAIGASNFWSIWHTICYYALQSLIRIIIAFVSSHRTSTNEYRFPPVFQKERLLVSCIQRTLETFIKSSVHLSGEHHMLSFVSKFGRFLLKAVLFLKRIIDSNLETSWS